MRDLMKIVEGVADPFAPFRGEDDPNYGKAYKNFCAVADSLQRSGFVQIGKGFHGFVFRAPNGVFKIFFDDASYGRFLKFAFANQGNPYMPRVSAADQITPLISVVHLEELEQLEPTEASSLIRALKWDSPFRKDGMLKPWPGLCSAMAALNTVRGPCQWDFEPSNFMKRSDGHLVINDPFKSPD